MMTWQSLDAWWWPFVFIMIGGWLATDSWRWLGVLIGNRLSDDSAVLIWVRSVATALVAAVIAKLILYPSGALLEFPVALRAGAAVFGFAVFLKFGRKPWIGIFTAVVTLVAGQIVLTSL